MPQLLPTPLQQFGPQPQQQAARVQQANLLKRVGQQVVPPHSGQELLLKRADPTEYTLYQVLNEAKVPFTTFLDFAPRDSKEKQDMESGSLPAA